jgi:hypothetical protein
MTAIDMTWLNLDWDHHGWQMTSNNQLLPIHYSFVHLLLSAK